MSEEWPHKMHHSRNGNAARRATISGECMTFHRVIDELADRLMP